MKRVIGFFAIMLIAAGMAIAAGSTESTYERIIHSLDREGLVEIKSDSPSIVIVQTDSSDAKTIVLSGSGRNRFNLTVKESGGDLFVEVKRKKSWLFKVFQQTQAELRVVLPTSWKTGSLKVGSVSGSIEISSPLDCQDIELATVSGSIQFKNLNTSANCELKSVSGAIGGRSLYGDEVEIETVSGSIEVDSIGLENRGTLDIHTISGRIGLPEFTGDTAALSSVSGAVKATIPADFSGRLVVKTVSGAINASLRDIDLESVDGRTRTYVKGKGNGLIEISTTSGAIDMRD